MTKKFIFLAISLFILGLVLFTFFFSETQIKIKQSQNFKESKFYTYYAEEELFAVHVWSKNNLEICKQQLQVLCHASREFDFPMVSISIDQDSLSIQKSIDKDSPLFQND